MNANINSNLNTSAACVMQEIEPNVFVIDVRSANNRIVSFENTNAASWMLEPSVLVSLEQLAQTLAAEYTQKAAQIKSKIQSSYVVGLWPMELNPTVLQGQELIALPKLKQLFAQTGAPSPAILTMLVNKHQNMMQAAAEGSAHAQACRVEEACEVLYGRFDTAVKAFVATLRVLSGDAFIGKPISTLVADVSSVTLDPLPVNHMASV